MNCAPSIVEFGVLVPRHRPQARRREVRTDRRRAPLARRRGGGNCDVPAIVRDADDESRSKSRSSRTCSAKTSIRSKKRWASRTSSTATASPKSGSRNASGAADPPITNALRLLDAVRPDQTLSASGSSVGASGARVARVPRGAARSGRAARRRRGPERPRHRGPGARARAPKPRRPAGDRARSVPRPRVVDRLRYRFATQIGARARASAAARSRSASPTTTSCCASSTCCSARRDRSAARGRCTGIYALVDPAASCRPAGLSRGAACAAACGWCKSARRTGSRPSCCDALVERVRQCRRTRDRQRRRRAGAARRRRPSRARKTPPGTISPRCGARSDRASSGSRAARRPRRGPSIRGRSTTSASGPIFATGSKADAGGPIGVNGVRVVVDATPLPVAAIGGITLAALPRVRETGAAMAAVISALARAADPEGAARAFVRAWTRRNSGRRGRRDHPSRLRPRGLLLELAAIRALGARPLAVVVGVSAQNAAHVLARTRDRPRRRSRRSSARSRRAPSAAFCVGALPDPMR